MHTDSLRFCVRRCAAIFLGLSCLVMGSIAQRATLHVQVPVLPAGSVDQGAIPGTAPVQFTVYVQPTADRLTALKAYLSAVQTTGNPAYHVWLTPEQFGQQFGATSEQIARINTWAAANGLTVSSGSSSGLSVTVVGTASQVETAISTGLHSVAIAGTQYIANTAAPAISSSVATDVLALGGLSTLPSSHAVAFGTSAGTILAIDPLSELTSIVAANSSRVVSMTSTTCAGDSDAATQAATQLALQQASAQGITVLASSGCGVAGSSSFPASLSEVTSVALKPGLASPVSASLTELRPSWQHAPGLSADDFRHEPDLTATDLAAFVKTISSILATMPANADGSPARLGNINTTLYNLGPMPGLYTQPDHAAAGTWEENTGLGLVDLDKLAKFYPRGSLATDVSISLDNYSQTHGSNITFTTVVKDISGQGNGAVPSGTVTFNVKPYGALGPATLNNGTATYTTNVLPGGAYTVTASYSGDATYAAKTSTVTDNFTIEPESATLSATEAAAVPIGSDATLAVTVKSASGVGTPTGKVNVIPSGTSDTNTYTGTLSGSGGTAVAQVLVPGVQAGSDVFLISCDGTDPSFTCPTQRVTANFLKATPAVTLTYSPTSPNSGDTVAFQAAIAAAGNNAASPTGNVNFLNNGAIFGAGTVSGGVATLTTNAYAYSASGNNFSASYGGDNNYNSNSSTTTVTSGTIPTTTVVNATPNSVPVGGQVTLTATVSPNQTSANAIGGSVSFVIGTTTLCTGTLANGIATCTATLGARGAYSPIEANYSGDTHFASSTSGSQYASVEVVSGTTTTTIAATPSSPTAGQSVTYTATVKNTNGSATAFPFTGAVAFYVNGTAVGSPTITNGQATYTATLGSAATTVYAMYSGDGNWAASTSPTLSFNSTSTTTGTGSVTTLTSSTSSALVGANIVLTATIAQATAGTSGSALSGSVTFQDLYNSQSTTLGTIGVSSNGPGAGYAQISTTGLKRGTHVITAVYSGNSSYSTSTSVALTISITDADLTFSPASISLTAGSSAATTATVTAYAGFTGQVTLACVPPAGTGITCSFNPSTLTNSGTSVLTVITTAQHADNQKINFGKAAGGVAFAGLFLALCLPSSRGRRPLLLACLVTIGLLGSVGCTNIINGANGQQLTSGTPSGTQYLTVTATASDGKTSTTHTQQFQVTVQ